MLVVQERSKPGPPADLNPKKRFVVYPGRERFPLDVQTEAIGLRELAKSLSSM